MKVEFSRHNLEEEDIERVVQVLRSIFLTTGPVTAQFERKFSEYTGLRFTVGLSSCTAALHLALLALGIGPGDEVITTPMTFIATATAIMHTGATPIFADVEADTALMDVSRVEEAVTPRTKAILPVHLYGSMADMRGLRDIADRYGLKIVEDCAHCIEGERDGVRPGQLSDAACYSFYATKNLTCGEGGALSTNDERLAQKVLNLRLHGMSRDAANRYGDKYQHWDMVAEGWKYNLDDIHSAMIVDQLDRLDDYLVRRHAIRKLYDECFKAIDWVEAPLTTGKSALHLYTIWVDPGRRDLLIHRFQDNGVSVAVNYRSIHNLTYFRERFGFKAQDFPNSNLVGERTISLPFYPKLLDTEAEYVAEVARSILGGS
jgi:dTDP-4-amino-4,6-dideoxygalactose transaminase